MKRKTLSAVIVIAVLSAIQSCSPKKEEEKKAPVEQAVAPTVSEVDRLTKEINANPQNADAYYQRAKMYSADKKFKLAFTDINRAVALDSTKGDYYLVQADVLFANLQIPQAKKAFEKCLSIDPKNIDAWLKIAELHLYLKKYKECIQYANEALKIDKHKSKAYFIKGFVYKESGDTAKAISNFQTCVEQEPENYDAYMQLGILNSNKNNKLAPQYFSSALRLNPKSLEALYGRGLYYQNNKEYNKAFEDYATILKIDPNYKDAYYNIGFIHLVYLKVYDEAIKDFSEAIRCDQYFVQAYYNRGLCYEKVGNISAAAADFNKALSIFPTYKLAKDGLKRLSQ